MMAVEKVSLRQRLRDHRSGLRAVSTWISWRSGVALGAAKSKHPIAEPCSLVIIPSDTFTVYGARGDEAMIEGLIDAHRQQHPSIKTVYVVTETAEAHEAIKSKGCVPLNAWGRSARHCAEAIMQTRPVAVVGIGADVMDGYYNPHRVSKMLAVCAMLSRQGVKSMIAGFSFNANPSQYLSGHMFRQAADDGVVLNVRDKLSFDRLKRYSKARAQLVADAAFLLRPSGDGSHTQGYESWIEARRAEGLTVLGVNFHPLLLKDPAVLDRFAVMLAATLNGELARRPLSLVMVPHDFRGDLGDVDILKKLASRLDAAHAGRVLCIDYPLSASEIKRVASKLDGVITGRMHLAIASLGVGTPVAAITYQDKFEGLFAHFAITGLTASPQDLMQAGRLDTFVASFLDGLDATRQQVAQALPEVKRLSRLNLAS